MSTCFSGSALARPAPDIEFERAHERRSSMTAISTWHIAGDWFDNCSCAVACPCTFAQPPDNGFCEFVLFWHIERGHYGDVCLDGLSFVRVGRWEGDLWAGKVKGAAGLFIDERADERQAEALPLILGGRAGGFPARLAALFTEGAADSRRGARPDHIRNRARPRPLGSGDRWKGVGLGK